MIAADLELVVANCGFESLGPVQSYPEALAAIDKRSFDFCVLDLDLGKFAQDPFDPGREGRQLLALLGMMEVPTVVSSGFVAARGAINALHGNAVCIDNVQPGRRLGEALQAFRATTA